MAGRLERNACLGVLSTPGSTEKRGPGGPGHRHRDFSPVTRASFTLTVKDRRTGLPVARTVLGCQGA